jgi:hypothetical protein
MRGSWLVGLAVLGSCGTEEGTHPCDAGTPTCESRLVVQFPDDRPEFHLTLTDAFGMDIDIRCPTKTTEPVSFGAYQAQCGGGRITVTTNQTLSDTITVKVEQAAPVDYQVEYARGVDFCGNECDVGTLNLL